MGSLSMQRVLGSLLLLLASSVISVSAFCDPDATGHLDPSENDVIPIDECRYYIDLNGWPYYLRHPYNCSRFWECATNGDICLFECQSCAFEGLCPQTHALYFNERLQYPYGPACDWPDSIDWCKNGWENCTLPCQVWQDNQCAPECCEDADCSTGQLCDNSGHCVIGCREHQDCEGWNGECPGCMWCDNPSNDVGQCKPGCLTDDQCQVGEVCQDHECVVVCPLPCQTIVNGQCAPECCEDADCSTGELCDSTGHCQLGDCRKGGDCNGYNTECQDPMESPIGCEYCDNIDSNAEIGHCKPGCENSLHDMCPNNPAYTCSGFHTCVAEGGTLLKKIHLATATCAGCAANDEGAMLHIAGTKQECDTGNLDHANRPDYAAGDTAVFASAVDVDLMAHCNNAEIAGGPKSVDMTWNGAGTWTPGKVKLEVSRDYFYDCTTPGGFSPITNGESVSLACVDCADSNC